MDVKLLIVEDDEDIRETVSVYLLDAGYQVDFCPDGDATLSVVKDMAHYY